VECAFSDDRREPDDLSATDARNKCTVMIYKCTVLDSVPIMRKRKPTSFDQRSALSTAWWRQFQHVERPHAELAHVAERHRLDRLYEAGHFSGRSPERTPKISMTTTRNARTEASTIAMR
jgi:hypothetical protein